MSSKQKKYATPEQVLAVKVAPLDEDYEIKVGDELFTFHIVGVGKYSERQAIFTEIARLREAPPTVLHNGEAFEPSDSDLVAACWAEACVKEPTLTSLQWLMFAQSAQIALKSIYIRALVASREMADPDKKDAKGAIDEAKEHLQDDPLERPSGDSV